MDRSVLLQELEALHAQCFAWALVCCDQQRTDAEDALQAAYLKVLDGSARFDERSSLRTWLFGVIRRTAAQERRRAWLRLHRLRNGHASAHAGPPAAADAELEREQRNQRLIDALHTLPRRQREVLELVFYHDMTIEQAGVVMGVAIGTARTHYERAKHNLQQRLSREDR